MKYEKEALPIIKEPGNAEKRHTGAWRTFKPIWNLSKCVKCKMCWLYCPENAISWGKNGPKVDYHICKGCLICKKACKTGAISSERDTHK